MLILLNNKKSCIDVITFPITQQQLTIGRSTILSDQVDNLLQDQIFFREADLIENVSVTKLRMACEYHPCGQI